MRKKKLLFDHQLRNLLLSLTVLHETTAYNASPALLQRVSSGDALAYRQLFDGYRKRVFSFAFYLIKNEAQAEDITQDIFAKIWEKRIELAKVLNFNAWLKTIVRNHTYSLLRRVALERIVLGHIKEGLPSDDRRTEDAAIIRDYEELLYKTIQSLPEQQRKVYLLSRQEGLKHQEIAEKMGLTVNTVKNYIKIALAKIRQSLDDHTDIMILLALAMLWKD
jgi:RNA polymerase sigma-70 factor (family 1)